MKTFRRFKIFRSGSSSQRSLLSKLFPVLCAIIIFCSPLTAYAADTVTFVPEFFNPTNYTTVVSVNTSEATLGTPVNGSNYVRYMHAQYSGRACSYTTASLPGGYSYSGTLGIKTTLSVPKLGVYSIDSVVFVIDNQEYYPFCTQSNNTTVQAYLSVKDLVVSSSSRILVYTYWHGYDSANSIASDSNAPKTSITFSSTVTMLGSGYKLEGTTSGFVDDISSFDDQMTEGSSKENNLTSSALTNVDSFELADPSSGSGMASALSFYSAVVTAGYVSLGDFQNLFIISLVIIVIMVLLRIRRS